MKHPFLQVSRGEVHPPNCLLRARVVFETPGTPPGGWLPRQLLRAEQLLLGAVEVQREVPEQRGHASRVSRSCRSTRARVARDVRTRASPRGRNNKERGHVNLLAFLFPCYFFGGGGEGLENEPARMLGLHSLQLGRGC